MGFRLLCCAVVFCCSAFFGLELRRRLFVRLRSLHFFREYFRAMKPFVSHFGMSPDDIAKELERREAFAEFSAILREKMRYDCFSDSFAVVLDAKRNSMCFTENDIAFLSSVVSKIGSMDRDGALELLDSADEHLNELIVSAKERCETDGKLLVVLSLSCGAVASLLLI